MTLPYYNALKLSGLHVPDLLGVLTNGTIGRELGSGSDVQQALAAEVQPVSILTVDLQLGIHVGSVVQQDEVVVSLVPGSAVQQSMIQLSLVVIGGHSAVHQGVDGAAQAVIVLIHASGAVSILAGLHELNVALFKLFFSFFPGFIPKISFL